MRRVVLVTDGSERAALAVVRSLGSAGHTVYVCSGRDRSLAGASRHARAEIRTPDALARPEEFVGALLDAVERWGIDTLIPVAEPALLAVLTREDALRERGVLLPFPPLETFRAVSDRQAVLGAAPSVGIAVPAEVAVASPEEAAELDPGRLEYPVVLKPARSVAGEGARRVKLLVRHVAEPSDLGASFDAFPPEAYPVLVQRRIVGPGTGVFLLLWDGEVRAAFAHRRIREKPPSGGVSVYRESIPLDLELTNRAAALLGRFDWRGVAMVELKVEAATGVPHLMEINGRFWGSLQLAVDAGVDFPRLLLDAACGVGGPGPRDYRVGVRSRWWWGDVDHLLTRLRRSDRALSLPPGSPSRARAVVEFLKLWRPGDRSEVLRISDPRPFLRETLQWLPR